MIVYRKQQLTKQCEDYLASHHDSTMTEMAKEKTTVVAVCLMYCSGQCSWYHVCEVIYQNPLWNVGYFSQCAQLVADIHHSNPITVIISRIFNICRHISTMQCSFYLKREQKSVEQKTIDYVLDYFCHRLHGKLLIFEDLQIVELEDNDSILKRIETLREQQHQNIKELLLRVLREYKYYLKIVSH